MRKIEEEESKRKFRFGDGEIKTSIKRVKIPANVVGKNIYIQADVVSCAIPLLLSKGSMKKAKVKINMENDTAVIFGKTLKLSCTSSGHYRVPLLDENQSTSTTEEI